MRKRISTLHWALALSFLFALLILATAITSCSQPPTSADSGTGSEEPESATGLSTMDASAPASGPLRRDPYGREQSTGFKLMPPARNVQYSDTLCYEIDDRRA